MLEILRCDNVAISLQKRSEIMLRQRKSVHSEKSCHIVVVIEASILSIQEQCFVNNVILLRCDNVITTFLGVYRCSLAQRYTMTQHFSNVV